MNFIQKEILYSRDTPVSKLTNVITSNKRGFNRHFNTKLYEEHKWLSGCENYILHHINYFFCLMYKTNYFFCLIFYSAFLYFTSTLQFQLLTVQVLLDL